MMGANAKRADDCDRFASSIHSYVDGELDADHAVDMEAHVIGCTECTEKIALLRAMRLSLKKKASPACPNGLRARMCSVVGRERVRAEQQREAQDAMSPKLIRLKYAVGLAAAAGVVLAMGMTRHAQHTMNGLTSASADTASLTSIDKLLYDLVALHANPIPPETTNPEELKTWDPLVGVPVRRPAFQPFGGSFHGARVLATADRRAAMLQYTVLGGHRVTIYVFNPRNVPMNVTQFQSRLVQRRPVLVGKLGGYSVAAAEQDGVGCALATDLDEDETSKMMVAAVNQ